MNSFFERYTMNDLLEEIKMVYLNDKRPWIIGYSGGKDSTAVVELVYRMLLSLEREELHKPVYIISSDTLVENPIIDIYLKRNIEMIAKSAKKDQLPISTQIVYPEYNDSFWANIIGKGYPPPKSLQYRWCTERLKIKPSNKFILNKLKIEEVVVLLGVRKDESIVRKTRIEKKQIDGYILTPNQNLKNGNNTAYTYAPIVDLTTDDVWTILLNENGDSTPWGTSNNDLFALYAKGTGNADGECPFITTDNKDNNTCGNSRFGCWVCTVVNEDKSLKGLIESGEEWLIPLAEFRDWLKSDEFRNNKKYRKKHRRNGAVLKTKSGNIMFGPFTFEGRQIILEKLLKVQVEIQKHDPELEIIKIEELKAIDKTWDEEEDLNRNTLVNIYKKITGESLPWSNYKEPIFDKEALDTIDELLEKNNIEKELFKSLILETDKYKHYSNPKKLKDSISKLLNQQWIHYDFEDELLNAEEDSNENK